VKRRTLLTTLALAVAALGCGYAPVRYADALGDAKTVAIVGLRNDSFEPGLESLVSGAVQKLGVARKSFSSVALALEYELELTLAVKVTRRDGTLVPLDASSQIETERYVASADVEVERTHREEALRRLAALLAGRIHDALFERIAP
jgi:hypothetical protein